MICKNSNLLQQEIYYAQVIYVLNRIDHEM